MNRAGHKPFLLRLVGSLVVCTAPYFSLAATNLAPPAAIRVALLAVAGDESL